MRDTSSKRAKCRCLVEEAKGRKIFERRARLSPPALNVAQLTKHGVSLN